jgi:hypothetical protein
MLADADREAHIEFIPGNELVAGHVIDYFDGQRRVDHFRTEVCGPVFDPERRPVRRVAVDATGDFELTILAEQLVPVLAPTALYQVEAYQTRTPHEPFETVPFAAETPEMADTIARRILILLGAAWGDIHAGDRYVDTVAVA